MAYCWFGFFQRSLLLSSWCVGVRNLGWRRTLWNPSTWPGFRHHERVAEETESRRGPALDRIVGNAVNSAVGVGLVQHVGPDVASSLGGMVGPLAEEASFA